MSLSLNGILPPLTTPFGDDATVDLSALRQNVARYNGTGLAGYVPLGTNGEAIHLSSRERLSVIETVRDAAKPGMTVIAGVNEHSTRAAIEAVDQAASAGADAVLVITPYYYKSAISQVNLKAHFEEVADKSPIPLVIYNVPQNTGMVIEPATIAGLAEHENIVGIKDSAGNIAAIGETIRRSPSDFAVLAGNGSILYPSLLMNAKGAILAVACVAPEACVALYESATTGDHAKALDLQNRIAPVSHLVTAGLGVPGLKAAMDLAGYSGGAPRAPLIRVTEDQTARIKSVMADSGIFADME